MGHIGGPGGRDRPRRRRHRSTTTLRLPIPVPATRAAATQPVRESRESLRWQLAVGGISCAVVVIGWLAEPLGARLVEALFGPSPAERRLRERVEMLERRVRDLERQNREN